MSNFSSLFEFYEPGQSTAWVAKPGRQTSFPLSIRNETGEGHDIAVCVEEPANWAWAMPQRISLDPGDETTVSIVFSPSRETTVAAGEHRAAIRLRDLEGVIFAECTRVFEVEERQELAMTVALRGPLMSFGLAEGFVLHCNLANRGNVDVTVTPTGDPHPSLSFSQRTVQVPFQGEVSFDIEVRWNASQRSNHPDTVTLRAPYRDGEASASIEWRYVAEALDPFMPIYSTAVEEDELLSLSWMQQPELNAAQPHSGIDIHPSKRSMAGSSQPEEPFAGPAAMSGGGADLHGSTDLPGSNGHASQMPAKDTAAVGGRTPDTQRVLQRPPPLQFFGPRHMQHTFGRRLNPWWPIAQKSGGRWRIKPLLLLLLVIAIEGIVIGLQDSQHDAFQAAASSKIPPISRALRFIPDTAAAIVGFGKHAILVTFHGAHRLSSPPAHLRVISQPPRRHLKATAGPASSSRIPAHKPAPKHSALPAKRSKPAAKRMSSQAKMKTALLIAAKHNHARGNTGKNVGSVKPSIPKAAVARPSASISVLTARYIPPTTVEITFREHGLSHLQLTLSDGGNILYNQHESGSATVRTGVPRRWYHPLQISLIGSAAAGVVIQRRTWLWKPGQK